MPGEAGKHVPGVIDPSRLYRTREGRPVIALQRRTLFDTPGQLMLFGNVSTGPYTYPRYQQWHADGRALRYTASADDLVRVS